MLPNLSIQAEETDFNENDVQGLINDLRAVVCTPQHGIKSRGRSNVCVQGRRKPWDGNDIHSRITSSRTAV